MTRTDPMSGDIDRAVAEALQRAKDIVGSSEAMARPALTALAHYLAFETSISVEAALGVLRAASSEGTGGQPRIEIRGSSEVKSGVSGCCVRRHSGPAR